MILSHHSRYKFTCECNEEDINDDDDEWLLPRWGEAMPPATRSELFSPSQPSIDFPGTVNSQSLLCREMDLFENLDIVHIRLLVDGASARTLSPAPLHLKPHLCWMLLKDIVSHFDPNIYIYIYIYICTRAAVSRLFPQRGRGLPHGRLRPFHRKSTCHMQLTFGQIWSRKPQNLRQRSPPCGRAGFGR